MRLAYRLADVLRREAAGQDRRAAETPCLRRERPREARAGPPGYAFNVSIEEQGVRPAGVGAQGIEIARIADAQSLNPLRPAGSYLLRRLAPVELDGLDRALLQYGCDVLIGDDRDPRDERRQRSCDCGSVSPSCVNISFTFPYSRV